MMVMMMIMMMMTLCVGSASFRTGTLGPDGTTALSVGVMMRVEADTAQDRFRVTVRSKHMKISQAIMHIFKSHLG